MVPIVISMATSLLTLVLLCESFLARREYALTLSCELYREPLIGHNGGARGVMVIVVGNGHGDTSSNPRRD